MNPAARKIQSVYLVLTLGNTLAASFIWGINTLFLLDAGLSNLEAFAANAFFTAGMVLFEVPTGVVADSWGRRASFLLGTVTLAGSTFLYYLLWQYSAPFWWWAAVSVLLGLGFTFFSGAVEAWLVDALQYSGYDGTLEAVHGGLRHPPVRYIMLAAPFTQGVGIYVFYALQPYLLQLFGDPRAYAVAGLAAAIVAGADVVGGWMAPRVRKLVHRRTTVLMVSNLASALILVALLFTTTFWLALVLLMLWGMVGSAGIPVRQAYLNDMIPSKQRATVLSFDSLMGSSGGVVVQPSLGRAADLYGYPASLAVSGAVQLLAAPFILMSRRRRSPADTATELAAPEESTG